MSLIQIEGDLTKVTGRCIIGHQVNPRVLGPILASALAKAYPECALEFNFRARSNNQLKLGEVMLCKIRPNFYVAHCCGQETTINGAVNTSMEAVHTYLQELSRKALILSLPVLLPVGLGSNRGGADWSEVFPLIEKYMSENTCFLVKLRKFMPIHVDELMANL